MLSDYGAEFRNAVVTQIWSKFGIIQTFTAAYKSAASGLIERANRKILEVLRPIVNYFFDNSEDWLPHVAVSIISSVNDSTGKSPHYVLFVVEKRLHYDLLTSTPQLVLQHRKLIPNNKYVISKIRSSVREKLTATKAEKAMKQHKKGNASKY